MTAARGTDETGTDRTGTDLPGTGGTDARTPERVPRATYRLQFGPDLGLGDAADLVGYLDDLGVSDVYASPILTAPSGATHGYHVVDPTAVNPEIGGDEGLRRLASALEAHGLGMLLDIVPNHLAASAANPWWRDVLQHGPSSRFARYFDIDWAANGGRVVLPTLGETLDQVIASGELRVVAGDQPELAYHDERFPLAPVTHDHARDLVATPSPEGMRTLADGQHYELAYWRTGVERINYRRFFDITDLVGLRVELPDVFDHRHERLLALVADGTVTGLRVDHVDGLRDPLGYLLRLQEAASAAAEADGFYVVVEKILEGDEPLPEEWPVAGTTGYELLNAVNAALVSRDGLARLEASYVARTGQGRAVADVLHDRKLDALRELFPGEVSGLVRRLRGLAASIPEVPDVPEDALRDVLVAATACFGVYRTYTRDIGPLRPEDRARLEEAFTEVRRRHPGLDGTALVFLERVLSLDLPLGLADDVRRDWLDVVLRWQQLTGPAMAKGFEDTTFYVVNRLISLNEVGVDADGIEHPHGVDGLHERTHARARAWPCTVNATSTHDTKRSEDVRARLHVLAEVPDLWDGTVARLNELAERYRTDLGGHTVPDPNEEWLLWQSTVGVWPVATDAEPQPKRTPAPPPGMAQRLAGFAVKAAREAKVHTSWLDRDDRHEAGLTDFVHGVLGDEAIVEELRALVDEIALPGIVNSLAAVTVKLLAPGVPDIYQGAELWDWSLVDPDNRRPVDHDLRRGLLDTVTDRARRDREGLARESLASWRDGRLKMLLTWTLLDLRARNEGLFRDAGYEPLHARGERADHVIAFARCRDDRAVTCIVPRLPLAIAGGGRWPTGGVWGDTELTLPAAAGAELSEAITGRTVAADGAGVVRLADALAALPVAALTTVRA